MVIQRDPGRNLASSPPLRLMSRTNGSIDLGRSPSRSPSPAYEDRLETFSAKSKFRRSFKKGVGLLFGSGNSSSRKKRPTTSSSVPTTPISTPQATAWRSRTPSFDSPVAAATETSEASSHALRATSRGPSPVPSPASGKRRLAASQAFKSIFPKWKSRPKGVFSSIWSPSPEGSNRWTSLSGRSIVLHDVPLPDLSEPERTALIRIALDRLSTMNLGPVTAPKDGSRRGLFKRGITLRKSKGNEKDRSSRDGSPSGLVFGQRLSKVLTHDKTVASLCRPTILSNERLNSLSSSSFSASSLPFSSPSFLSSSTSLSSLSDVIPTPPLPPTPPSGDEMRAKPQRYLFDMQKDVETIRSGSVGGTQKPAALRSRKNSAPDVSFPPELQPAVSVSVSAGPKKTEREYHAFMPLPVQVPSIVSKSIRFLEEYGLHSTGLFRVSGSKKRVRQMREEWDAGNDIQLGPNLNPHDVAALLKMFLRDLPEPLLTRELYSPFIATRKLEDGDGRLRALSLLCALLPPANRDMLMELLRFLNRLSQHADCNCEMPVAATEDQERGNKMNVTNLATVVGPNILHKRKSGQKEKEFAIIKQDQADDREEVIAVVRDLIIHYQDMGKIPASVHDAILRRLVIDEPEATDFLLKKKSLDIGIDSRDSNDDDDDGGVLYFSKNHFSAIDRSGGSTSVDDPDSFVFCNPALRNTRKVDSVNSLNSADLDFYDRSSPPAQQFRIRTSGSASDLKLEHRHSPRSALRSAPQTPTRKWIPPMKMSIRTTVTPATPETGRRRSSPDSRAVAAAAALRKVTHVNDLRTDSTEEDILTATSAGSESGGTTSPALSPRSSTGEIEALPRATGVLSFPWQNKEQLKEWGLQAGDIELLEQETLV